ncbi:MAG: hypothetical protein M1815_002493 [Lichina confinis]|nr:MAG: hypothetical protein M1815_002493 [Lichina confinis]
MAGPVDPDDELVDKLKCGVDPKVAEKRERLVNDRRRTQYEQAQQRLADLVDSNTTLPLTIASVKFLGARHTRKDFLAEVVRPLLSSNRDGPYTLAEVLAEINAVATKLHKFDIFKVPISLHLDRPDPTVPSSTPNDISVYYAVRERPRILARTGTEAGTAEGSAYGNVLCRNVFGGAETLNIGGSLGTRTRSAYSAWFGAPVQSNPDVRWEIGGFGSSTANNWASHEEVSKGLSTRLRWVNKWSHQHELGYQGIWRQITGLAENASPTIRGEAGDSVKSSVSHTWINDRRDNPILPSKGYNLKAATEVAGWGPLLGDVAFWKSELESQVAVPVPVPGIRANGVTLTAGLRGGLLYPLTPPGQTQSSHSRINDRFRVGGPTDIRGFRLAGLGPRDGHDALGGDMYYAASANLFLPLPRVNPQRPIRFQLFVNGGRLLALKGNSSAAEDVAEKASTAPSSSSLATRSPSPSSEQTSSTFSLARETASSLFDGLPSTAAGVGLVYAHPVARFELNFSLPLAVRRGEQGRKGLSFGVGMSFL